MLYLVGSAIMSRLQTTKELWVENVLERKLTSEITSFMLLDLIFHTEYIITKSKGTSVTI